MGLREQIPGQSINAKVKKHKCTEHSLRAERPADNAGFVLFCLRFTYLQFIHMRKRPCKYMKSMKSPWRWKSPSDFLELELQATMNCPVWFLETKPGSSAICKSSKCS